MSDEVLDSVKKCVGTIKGAKTDTEKFAALFMVTKTVKAEKCNARSKLALFDAIEFKFIKRLLLSDDVPAGCPPFVYKSVAMSILTALCSVQEVATHKEILQNIDVFLDIVVSEGDEDEEDEDSLMLVNEAYKCLNFIALFEQGLKALFDADTVGKMCKVYSQKSFQTDEALSLLVTIVEKFGPSSWENNVQNFNTLMNILAVDFETDHSDRKFKLSSLLSPLLGNCPVEIVQNSYESEIWPNKLFIGLRDILTSKLIKSQRDPAIKLTGQMLTTFGVEWCLQDETKPKAFFLLLIHLASIEIRMHLEEKKIEQVLAVENLLSSCFTILEISIAYIAEDTLDLEQKEKQQTYTALKGAFSAVLNVLKTFSVSKKPLEVNEKRFICLMLMSLSAWMSLETSAMKSAVHSILPFALQIANESFYAYRTRYISENVKTETLPVTLENDPLSSVDVLRAFLPALCHIAVDDKGRAVLLKIKQEDVLHECLVFHWSIAHYKKPLIPKSERNKPRGPEPDIPADRLKKMIDSRGAIISLCNTFMNICVLEADHVVNSPLFFTLMKFVFDNLPELKNNHENLVMYGNMAVLGLLLLKLKTAYIKKNDFSICRYIQSTIRFLWDAYTVDENSNSSRFALGQLVVTMTYKESWMELQELWFLGMQNLSGILTLVPWISEFAIESGWAEGIIDMLVKIKPGSLPTNVKYAYEDLLCRLIEANSDLIATLKKKDAITACRGHKFMELGKKLFGE